MEKLELQEVANMNPEHFIIWLKGFVELNGRVPTAREWQIIKDHVAEVFNKTTPDRKIEEPTYCSPTESQIPWSGVPDDWGAVWRGETGFRPQIKPSGFPPNFSEIDFKLIC